MKYHEDASRSEKLEQLVTPELDNNSDLAENVQEVQERITL